MKTRLLAMGSAVFFTAVLAACGGGGGGGGTPPPIETPTPTVAPTSTPTPNPFGCVGASPFAVTRRTMANPPNPVGSGDTFQYAGSIQTVYTQSAPCPQPTSTSSATVSISVTNFATSGPGSATTDQRSVETDAYPTESVKTTTDLAVTDTASAYELFQTKTTDTSGNVITTAYGNPQELDDLPQTQGASWSNNPAATLTEAISDGTAITRHIASDGSYTDGETFVDGTQANIIVNGAINAKALDGSGSYAFDYAGGRVITLTMGAPGGGSILITATDNTQPGQATITVPAWFAGGTGPATFISDSFADNGMQPFDGHCTVNASIGTQGEQIVETYRVLDPVVGYTDVRTTTSYVVPGFGASCVAISDTLDSYYDYNLDTTVLMYPSANGQPNSVNTITEYLGMSSPSSPYAQSRVRASESSPVSPALVAARIATIDHVRETQRARRIEQMKNALAVKRFGGKVK